MRKLWISSAIITVLAITATMAATPTITLKGTVKQKDGAALSDVAISLANETGPTTVTDSTGSFVLTTVRALQLNAPKARSIDFRLSGRNVVFSAGNEKLNGSVSVFSGNGRRVAHVVFSDLHPASENVTLPELAPGLNIIRLSINGNPYSCQVLNLGNEQFLMNTRSGSSNRDFSLNKAAAGAAVDTLVAKKEGFKDAKLAITSYIDSGLAIVMDSAGGGTVGEIAWGKEENPTAGLYEGGDWPSASELTANNKLPDPFMGPDGKRITKMSEWPKQREYLRQQVLHYIYGDKPIPAKGSVSGTVSESKISVIVNEDGKSCAFDVTVKMNGATKPAPALISYGAGASAPSGVASISFRAVEAQGGSGNKSGPFYDFYGKTHAAGYMTAQAWQISRLIDLLEQQPDIIDPYRIATTGCSRNGKGAFAGGLLDNRVALAIPCESGIGGAVALRLVEQLGGGEWPYHSISYVRWLSEVALGPFTNANNASGDNTNKLPVDMHTAMALAWPNGMYIVDNPSINNLDPKEAWVTATAGKMIYEALGSKDDLAYVGANGGHCQWRSQYTGELNDMVDKFLKGNESAKTGEMSGNANADPSKFIDWDIPTLENDL